MKNTVIARVQNAANFPETDLWLDLAAIANVEISSEDEAHPFENCLSMGGSSWRASIPGPQSIRFVFHKPERIRHIHLEFSEASIERVQEFTLVAHSAGMPPKEVMRQQWAFSPGGATSENEDYIVNLQESNSAGATDRPGTSR